MLAPRGTSPATAQKWLKYAKDGVFVLVAAAGDLDHPYRLLVTSKLGVVVERRIKLAGGKYSITVGDEEGCGDGNDVEEFDGLRALVVHYSSVDVPAHDTKLRRGLVAEPTTAEYTVRRQVLCLRHDATICASCRLCIVQWLMRSMRSV